LNKEGFPGVFSGWKAAAILGLDKDDVLEELSGSEGKRHWGFLNTARQSSVVGASQAIFVLVVQFCMEDPELDVAILSMKWLRSTMARSVLI
jgi:hypothetical protein